MTPAEATGTDEAGATTATEPATAASEAAPLAIAVSVNVIVHPVSIPAVSELPRATMRSFIPS